MSCLVLQAPSHTKGYTPGSVSSCDNGGFTTAYVAMCARAGVTFAAAVEARYDLLMARNGTAAAEDEDDEELEMIGCPQGDDGSAERTAWFEDWAAKKEAAGGEGGGEGGGGMDPMAAMQAMAAGGAGGGPVQKTKKSCT